MTKLTNINEILNSIQKNLKVPKDKKNSFGNFQYRNAEGILEAYKEEVKDEKYPNDLILTNHFELELIGSRLFAICYSTLELADGSKKGANAFAEIDVSKKGMDQSQLSGAVTSYAKKYALCNLFSIDDSKDDPDADEEPKEEKKPILQKLAESAQEDMKEIFSQRDSEIVARLIKAIKEKASMPALQEWLENDAVKKEMNRLKKSHTQGYNSVQIALKAHISENQWDIDDSSRLEEIGQ